jgi:hypothetical protein
VYYRVRLDGASVPRSGPVLLLANHPNTLLDPAFVLAVSHRPVRFLAKATLFQDRWLAWFVRDAGAIPVFRRQDDPTRMDANRGRSPPSRRLASGAAASSQRISHSSRARAAAHRRGAAGWNRCPHQLGALIIPIGLRCATARTIPSEALVLIGPPAEWDDSGARRGFYDAEAVCSLSRSRTRHPGRSTFKGGRIGRSSTAPCGSGAACGAPHGPDRVRRADTAARLLAEVAPRGPTGTMKLRPSCAHTPRARHPGCARRPRADDAPAVPDHRTRALLLLPASPWRSQGSIVLGAGGVTGWPSTGWVLTGPSSYNLGDAVLRRLDRRAPQAIGWIASGRSAPPLDFPAIARRLIRGAGVRLSVPAASSCSALPRSAAAPRARLSWIGFARIEAVVVG